MLINLIIIVGVSLMAHDDDHSQYLSDAVTVDTVYALIQSGDVEKAADYIKGLGEKQVVAQTFVQVQCDINNVKHDPVGSAQLAQFGIDFMTENGFKVGASMMLHNVCAFFMPEWDENVVEGATTTGLEAARKALPIRQEIGEPGPLMWAYWDLGMCLLVSGSIDEAIQTFEEGVKVAKGQEDKDGESWCQLFIGKAKIKYKPEMKAEGEKQMLDAAITINEVGQDWEKEEIVKILKSVNLTLE